MTSSIFVRILIAAIFAIVLLAILPPFFRLVGFPVEGDLWTIIRICVAAIAVFYVFTGRPALFG